MRKKGLLLLFLLTGMVLAAYEVIVFGDVHFDSKKVRDPDIKLQAYQEKEMRRNLSKGKNFPALLKLAAAKVTPGTAFVVQLGDLVQGDCGKGELHKKSLNMALGLFRDAFPRLRFFLTPGNHDIRGEGAASAYPEVMIPYLSGVLKEKLSSAPTVQYFLTQDQDLFVFWDSNHPDTDFLEAVIAAHPERRHLFVLAHLPVIPVAQKTPSWVIFGRPDKPVQRKKLIRILAKNNAVVLCAHIHHSTFLRWQNEEGTIVQVTFFSIIPPKTAKFNIAERDPGSPFPLSSDLSVVGDFLGGYREIKEIRPGSGFAVLKSSAEGVFVDFYHSGTPKSTCQLKLK